MIDESKAAADPAELFPFFQRVDWAGFWLTFLLALSVYLLTLAPDVTLEYSGVYSTAAMYPGPSIPPGHPLWVIYGWLFIKLIPFSNIAWRLNLASAMAGAVTCALVALLVSRVGMLSAENNSGFNRFSTKEQNAFRLVCGCVAGLGLGFDGCFWCKAVVADTWPLSVCLFALTICLLTRWVFAPQQLRYLFAAVFVYGLTLSESQALIPAALGLPFVVAVGNRKLSRDLFFGISLFLWVFQLLENRLLQLGWSVNTPDEWLLLSVAGIATLVWSIQSLQTGGLLSEWKATVICAGLFFAGISAYFLLPVFSMTNPPINWGYASTVEGFFHLLSRGQFESLYPASGFRQLMTQWGIYAHITIDNFGALYLLAAAVPFVWPHKLALQARRWMFGLLALWFVVTLLMLVGLNMDCVSAPCMKPYFAVSHLILTLFSGCGLMLIAAFGARLVATKSQG